MTLRRAAWGMVAVGLGIIVASERLPGPVAVLVALAAGLLAAMGILFLVMPQ